MKHVKLFEQFLDMFNPINDDNHITEKQFKGLTSDQSLEDIDNDQKLKIIQSTGNIIDFKVPDWANRNFWQVISKGKISKKKNLNGDTVFFLPGKVISSPTYNSIEELIDNVLWDSMEQRRRFNESNRIDESKNIKLKDLEGQTFMFNVGNTGEKLKNASKSDIAKMVGNALRHYLFDQDFYYNYTDNKKEYATLYANTIEMPMVKQLDKTIKEWFIYRDLEKWEWGEGKVLEFRYEKARDFIDNWFMETKMSESLRQEYIDHREDYAGVTLKPKK